MERALIDPYLRPLRPSRICLRRGTISTRQVPVIAESTTALISKWLLS
jgi:hypothetical protein